MCCMKMRILIGLFLCSGSVWAEQYTRQQYVEMYRQIAVQQMISNRIPASVTLAQGILESASGNSRLAKEGNNHFGIKCHSGWTGKSMFLDDDTKNECFRVYESPLQSYEDHGLFLKNNTRYASLFALDIMDYKGWTSGLKEAGYATNPAYASLLNQVIEDLKLTDFDKIGSQSNNGFGLLSKNDQDVYQEHELLFTRNRAAYVVARKGDTFYQLASEFGVTVRQLARFNDFSKRKDVLVEGDVVYVKPKKRKGFFPVMELAKDQSLRDLSQDLGIKMKRLEQLNRIEDGDKVLPKGTRIILR
jgi:LysM repeat protein